MNNTASSIWLEYKHRKMWLCWSILFFAFSAWSINHHFVWIDIAAQLTIGIGSIVMYATIKPPVVKVSVPIPTAVEPIRYIPLSSLRSYEYGQYVYVIQDLDVTGMFKIGKTHYPEKRILDFGVHLPFNVGIVHIIPTDNMNRLERTLHRKFAVKRVRGEWFDLDPSDIEYIRSIGDSQNDA